MASKVMHRKNLLWGAAGACLALPILECNAQSSHVPKRMFATGMFYSFMPDYFFPKSTGKQYDMPKTLDSMAQHRHDFTIFSGLDHNLSGGHESTKYFLNGIKTNQSKGYKDGNISVDQKAAEFVGSKTRFPSLALSCFGGKSDSLSWNRNSAQLMTIDKLDDLKNLLFSNPTKKVIKEKEIEYRERESILDLVRLQAKKYESKLGKNDRDKLDQYFTSVRELELKMGQSKVWLHRDKPASQYKLPSSTYGMTLRQRLPLFYDLITLALQTDSTRVVTLDCHSLGRDSGGLSGISQDYHALSHHGKVQKSMNELLLIEKFYMSQFSRFIAKLKAIKEPNGKTMLDSTMALIGSGMGNANSHSNKDLPVLLAGGGFMHGEHKHYEKVGRESTPLCNLYLSMLQNFGLEIDQFNLSKGTLNGFEFAS